MLKRTGMAAIAVLAGSLAAQAQDKAALGEEAKALMQQFAGALQGELKAAIEAGGPVNAIAVCNEKAPEIAAQISGTNGWEISRSSHALRNPANAPDDYTAEAIASFLDREAAGEKAAGMVQAEIVEEDGQQVFRLVKAIPTGGLCLNCHGGDQVRPEVEAKLAELYPGDQARGFEEGQMRGVFTLRKVLSE